MATKPASIGNGGGLNCTLSYKKDGKTRAYRLRCVGIAHGLQQIATEGHARTTRAYYPHRRTQAQFMLTFALMGRRQVHDHSEKERFNAWLRDYMSYLLDADDLASVATFPRMDISIPVRNFKRQGIPIASVKYGEHVGSMLWLQTIVFETTLEPLDANFAISSFNANGTDKDKNSRFFYPGSKQLSGSQKPDTYDTVTVTTPGILADGSTNAPDVTDVQAAVGAPYEEPNTNSARGIKL
jgi:hypothetical protein